MERLEYGPLKQVTVMHAVKYVACQCPFCKACLLIHLGVGCTIKGSRLTIRFQETTPQSDYFVSRVIAKEDMQNSPIFKSCVGCNDGIGKLVDYVFSGGFMDSTILKGDPDEIRERLKG